MLNKSHVTIAFTTDISNQTPEKCKCKKLAFLSSSSTANYAMFIKNKMELEQYFLFNYHQITNMEKKMDIKMSLGQKYGFNFQITAFIITYK